MPTALAIVVLIVVALLIGLITSLVVATPLLFWRLPARRRDRLAARGLTHVMQARYLSRTDLGGDAVVELRRRRTWFPTLLGRHLVFVYVGSPRRLALLFNHSKKLRRQPIWTAVTLSPTAAQTWLVGARVWYRPLDRALAVDRDYLGPALVTETVTLIDLAAAAGER